MRSRLAKPQYGQVNTDSRMIVLTVNALCSGCNLDCRLGAVKVKQPAASSGVLELPELPPTDAGVEERPSC